MTIMTKPLIPLLFFFVMPLVKIPFIKGVMVAAAYCPIKPPVSYFFLFPPS